MADDPLKNLQAIGKLKAESFAGGELTAAPVRLRCATRTRFPLRSPAWLRHA
jgi:hypothetical protein